MSFKQYNGIEIINWNRQEEQKYKVCCKCGLWGTFALQTKHGSYYFLCGKHYFEAKNENKDQNKQKKIDDQKSSYGLFR